MNSPTPPQMLIQRLQWFKEENARYHNDVLDDLIQATTEFAVVWEGPDLSLNFKLSKLDAAVAVAYEYSDFFENLPKDRNQECMRKILQVMVKFHDLLKMEVKDSWNNTHHRESFFASSHLYTAEVVVGCDALMMDFLGKKYYPATYKKR